jgi:hypothetical protein
VDKAGDDMGMRWRVPVDDRFTTWGLSRAAARIERLTCDDFVPSLWRKKSSEKLGKNGR